MSFGRGEIDMKRATKRRQKQSLALLRAQFEPIESISLTDRVYRAIKERILNQDIPVGARLHDEQLQRELGVSRTPIREALSKLTREGLVEVIPRSRTHVRTFSEDDINQLFEVRIALETLAVRKAVERLESGMLHELRELYEEAEKSLKHGNLKPSLRFDAEMHRMILEASGNAWLQNIMSTINDFVVLFRNIGATSSSHKRFNYRHGEIVQALEQKDCASGVRSLTEHIEVAREDTVRDFRHKHYLKHDDEKD
jgi:DNA-binding GntR family transcriptional regulator